MLQQCCTITSFASLQATLFQCHGLKIHQVSYIEVQSYRTDNRKEWRGPERNIKNWTLANSVKRKYGQSWECLALVILSHCLKSTKKKSHFLASRKLFSHAETLIKERRLLFCKAENPGSFHCLNGFCRNIFLEMNERSELGALVPNLTKSEPNF